MTAPVGLRFDADDGGYSRYMGSLPYGLSWGDDIAAIGTAMGSDPDNVSGGNGFPVSFEYYASDGYVVALLVSARHNRPEDMADARLIQINISLR